MACDVAKTVLLSSIFLRGDKRVRISLTTRNLYWEFEDSRELCCVIPLNEIIAATPCDCLVDYEQKKTKCHHCRLSGYHVSHVLQEPLPLHAQNLRLHYVVPHGCHEWRLISKVFHPVDAFILREWICVIQLALLELNRIKKLLVFINPFGGKKKGMRIYEKKVLPIFLLAGIDAHVIVTKRTNHAKDVLQDIDFHKFDGIVCVGGDGMFSEILNAVLLKTHKEKGIDVNDIYNSLIKPIIPIGIIPAGSTNAAVNCITGAIDPVTSALLIVMGDTVGIDVCSIHYQGTLLRFAVTFLSYGYFGDVILDSEKFRWMGPNRYNFSGIRKVLQRRLYSGELQLQVPVPSDRSIWENEKCGIRCVVCSKASKKFRSPDLTINNMEEKARWLNVKGQFIAVNSVIMKCACATTPQGFSPSQHLGNGYCDVIIISSCSRFNYLRFLYRTSCNKNPFDLDFVQVHRVKEFRFSPFLNEDKTPSTGCGGIQENWQQLKSSVWNCDGEVIPEASLNAKIHCQLLNVFGRGFEDRKIETTYSQCFDFFRKKKGH